MLLFWLPVRHQRTVHIVVLTASKLELAFLSVHRIIAKVHETGGDEHNSAATKRHLIKFAFLSGHLDFKAAFIAQNVEFKASFHMFVKDLHLDKACIPGKILSRLSPTTWPWRRTLTNGDVKYLFRRCALSPPYSDHCIERNYCEKREKCSDFTSYWTVFYRLDKWRPCCSFRHPEVSWWFVYNCGSKGLGSTHSPQHLLLWWISGQIFRRDACRSIVVGSIRRPWTPKGNKLWINLLTVSSYWKPNHPS